MGQSSLYGCINCHLVREVELYGPVFFIWMYPFERYIKVFEGYIRNRNRTEGCIAEAYIAEEALEFLDEWILYEATMGVPQSGRFDAFNRSKPLSCATVVKVTEKELHLAHLCVLQNLVEARPYFDEHMTFLKNTWPRKIETWLVRKQNVTFSNWIKKKVSVELNDGTNLVPENLIWIANGPNEYVPTFRANKINGGLFCYKRER